MLKHPPPYLGVEELDMQGHGLVAAGGVPALGAAQVRKVGRRSRH